MMSGYSAEEVRTMGEMGDKTVSEKARERLMALAKDSLEEEMRKNGMRQRVVENGEVAENIRGGWEFCRGNPRDEPVRREAAGYPVICAS
jgi:hypothetical protein